MTITGLIVGTVLLLAALAVVTHPLMQQRRNENRELSAVVTQKKRDELLTSYERVLATIRDLDEDHNTGKLTPETYQHERAYWTEQGILLLQQLEPDTNDDTTSLNEQPEESAAEQALDEAIEKAIAEYRKAGVHA